MPLVSIIVPCYNERTTIHLLLEALYAQSYPRAEMEVVIADGRSTDGTRQQIDEFRACHPDLTIQVIDNPQRTIATGLNLAIQAAGGEFLVRLDAHSIPRPDYVQRCLAVLTAGRGDMVGGIWEIQPGGQGWIANAIAAAAAHPLGVGDALYRYAGRAGAVDTVPFGAFRRTLVQRVGGYDETLLTNEDYEFNTRIRLAGGVVWLDPGIRSTYFARKTLSALARQYARYGYWKARMLRRYPATLRWRQALPPAFVLSLIVCAVLALFWSIFAWLFVFEILGYGVCLILAGLQIALKEKDGSLGIGVPIAIAVMHFSWGAAFLWSLFRWEK